MKLRRLPRAALVCVAAALLGPGCDAIPSGLISRQVNAPDRSDWLSDGALHVYLCGTGSPLPSRRAGPCTAVIAAGHFLLIDVGPGSGANLGLHRLPRERVDAVLLTHFHSDHIGELGEIGMQSWALGRREPLPVYGPPGVDEVVAGFEKAYALDTQYRIDHHGADLMVPANRPLVPRAVPPPPPGEAAVVLEDGDLRVLVFAVDHAPVAPAYGYRIDYGGRSVLVSGDTARNTNLVERARGVDLLVHEALAKRLIEAGRDAAAQAGFERRARILGDVIEYHTSPVEAAEVAALSGAKMLVLTHLVPPPANAVVRRLFLRGADEAFDGEVVLGEDGMHFRLPGGGDRIEMERLD